jgi:alkylation response protein AidB-like acyl-CoA dehydrogenase
MPARPATTATVSGGSGSVSGAKIGVPDAAAARWILVPAALSSGGTAVVIVDPLADGVSMQRTPSSAGGPEYTLQLNAAPVAHVLGAGGEPVVDDAQQAADAYIASRTLHLATLSACWRLETQREAASDLDVAAYWLARHAPAALRACHHLHGGIGMDVSYPLHRYSSLVKDLVRFVGGADYCLDRLGARTCD